MDEKKIPIVMKFGGTSVADAAAFERVALIAAGERAAGRAPIVVTSAMSRVTDALLAAFDTAKTGDFQSALESLNPHLERHLLVASQLIEAGRQTNFRGDLDSLKNELGELFERVANRALPLVMLKDAVVSYGEQLSSRLLTEILRAKNLNSRLVDARRLIVTDEEYGAAQPFWTETENLIQLELQPLIDAGEIPVLGGFIAASKNGETTVLGRGGSDYSAALIGAALRAAEIQIWTDVTGVLTCDPRVCPEARTIKTLSYEQAAELAYFGAKVLHPKTIQPAVDFSIPVRVCNSQKPLERGTMILPQADATKRTVKSIAHKTGITILRISSARMLGAYGFMSALFQIFERYRTVIDVISTSEVSVSLTLDDTQSLEPIVRELKRLGTVEIESKMAVVCVVGEGLRGTSGVASRIFSTISDVNISLISHGASSVNMTFVVDEAEVKSVIKKLHDEFFGDL